MFAAVRISAVVVRFAAFLQQPCVPSYGSSLATLKNRTKVAEKWACRKFSF